MSTSSRSSEYVDEVGPDSNVPSDESESVDLAEVTYTALYDSMPDVVSLSVNGGEIIVRST